MGNILSAASLGVGVFGLIAGVAFILCITGGRPIASLGGLEGKKFCRIGFVFTILTVVFYFGYLWYAGNIKIKIAELQYGKGIVVPPEIVVVEVTQIPKIAQASEATPSSKPINIPTPRFSYDISRDSGDLDVAEFVSYYFEGINAAQNSSDLQWGWERLSNNLKAVSNNSLGRYTEEWLKYRVQYEVWRCSDTSVDVKLTYFGKGDINFINEYTSLWIHYKLSITRGNEWLFESGVSVDSHGTNCSLAFNN